MGVKSLWTLLTPIGRPVMLETVEGKAMAIDSSIWIYQFQATMRDKEGRALINAHVLGFLRRISKLLFYGIKPVFVFDGGAPALKRATLNERKQKKSGAAASHVKVAEKLLAAQMRREALNAAQGANSAKKEAKRKSTALDDNTVYLEDLEGPPRTPARPKPKSSSSSSSKKANKYRDHDPYRLPEVNMEEKVTKATRSAVPDPRLATEEELRLFIEEMRPEDFDINSPAFRELPTEVQYEIVGDLRLKSRQTSYARLQKMLQTSRTPLDFSKQQIQNLRQRNALTQQLLITTDSIGSAHIAIPVRIASERNKQYVLIKNEGESGGWILGIRDVGTREKPITIDHDDEQPVNDGQDDSDNDMEEVEVPTAGMLDSDLRKYHSAKAQEGSPAMPYRGLPINRKTKSNPFIVEHQEDVLSEDEDELLSIAIERSLDNSHSPPTKTTPRKDTTASTLYHPILDTKVTPPSRLKTALTFAGPSHGHTRTPLTKPGPSPPVFGKPSFLSSPWKEPLSPSFKSLESTVVALDDTSGGLSPPTKASRFGTPALLSTPEKIGSSRITADKETRPAGISQETNTVEKFLQPQSDSDEELEEVATVDMPMRPSTPTKPVSSLFGTRTLLSIPEKINCSPTPKSFDDKESQPAAGISQETSRAADEPLQPESESGEEVPVGVASTASTLDSTVLNIFPIDSDENVVQASPLFAERSSQSLFHEDPEDDLIEWFRTPSPVLNSHPVSSAAHDQEWDAANEIDAQVEAGEFARFMSQVKEKDIDDVRREIDDEINELNRQRKAAMRDSEDLTQQMITQIMTMLRLFGIPYITAPMEAEAQCAELVSLNLVDGVITDDSDVFLFGAQRVYKNMFNQSKTVECFLLSDLSRDLGLDRDTLIRLAYLLGSDYTEGLSGVGPVVAMELLREFPGRAGLHEFREWWTKVQSGKDRDDDNQSKFRRQFKKKFKSLYLPSDWPDSLVRDAYYHPKVDSSEEPFHWGMPDLDGLRIFFHQELGWQQSKVDDLLLPIIQSMNKRNQAAAMNKQGVLNEFLDISSGSGTHAPRQRQAYASRRLQEVISDFRKQQKTGSVTPASRSPSRAPSRDADGGDDSRHSHNSEQPAAKKRKTKGKSSAHGRRVAIGAPRGRGSRKSRAMSLMDADEQLAAESDDEDNFTPPQDFVMDESARERELRPRVRPRPAYRVAEEREDSVMISDDA